MGRRVKECSLSLEGWTKVRSSEGENEATIWRKSYWDGNEHRCILKVDSHQLNEQGTARKINAPRYSNLVPCLALLNANHWADKAAEDERKLSPQFKKDGVAQPPSGEIFTFHYEGKSMDKDVTETLKGVFEKERLKRIRTKETQGLPWRMFPHCLGDPAEYQLRSSWRRCTMGLTNTHSRCVYKSKEYRVGILTAAAKLESKEARIDMAKKLMNEKATQELIRSLLPCRWCDQQESNPVIKEIWETRKALKGNRRHAFLYCQHPKLVSVRNEANNCIESQFRKIYELMKSFTSAAQAMALFIRCGTTLEILHREQVGKLARNTNEPDATNFMGLDEILRICEATNIEDAIMKDKNIFSYLFAVIPGAPDGTIQDGGSDAVDNLYLGFIPTQLHNTMIQGSKFLLSVALTGKTLDGAHGQIQSLWDQTVDLFKAKCIAMHRACNIISKNMLLMMQKDLDLLPKYKDTKMKKAATSNNATSKRTGANRFSCDKGVDEKPKSKFCQGVTCLFNSPWNEARMIPQVNKIPMNTRNCARCSKTNTALRKAASMCGIIMENDGEKQNTKLNHWLSTKWGQRMDVLQLYNIFGYDLYQAPAVGKLKDGEKMVAKIMAIIFRCKLRGHELELSNAISCPLTRKRPASAVFAQEELECLQHSSQAIGVSALVEFKCHMCGNTSHKLRTIKYACSIPKCFCVPYYISFSARVGSIWIAGIMGKDISRRLQESDARGLEMTISTCNRKKSSQPIPSQEGSKEDADKSNKEQPASQSTEELKDDRGKSQRREKISPLIHAVKNTKTIQQDKNEKVDPNAAGPIADRVARREASRLTLIRGQPTSGDTMALAVISLRRIAPLDSCFLTNSSFLELTARPTSNNWRFTCRLFKNNRARQRADGLYIIPCFERGSTIGHHFLAVVQRLDKVYTGAIFDSLGVCDKTSKIGTKNLIEQAFEIVDEVQWLDTSCNCQSELECGARTIVAMTKTIRGKAAGAELEDLIPSIQYQPEAEVRKLAAEIISEGGEWRQKIDSELRESHRLDLSVVQEVRVDDAWRAPHRSKPNKRNGGRAARRRRRRQIRGGH